MKARTYQVVTVVERYSEAVDRVPAAGDCAVVKRGSRYRQLVMRCPDGCGEVLSINLDPRTGPAWRAYRRADQWTVYPSIDKPSGCKSHFILVRGRILWCDWDDERDADVPGDDLSDRVLPLLSAIRTSFVELADQLDEIPWDVLRACRCLVHSGKAVEGRLLDRGTFWLPPTDDGIPDSSSR